MPSEHAAGGVVYRGIPGAREVLMIRDRFNRWTLPKGKLEKGESSRQAALREIREETGIQGKIMAELLSINYEYNDLSRGLVSKQVDYYLVEALSEDITPQLEEISSAHWLTLEQAVKDCGYENNYPVLLKAQEMLETVLD